MTKSLDDLAQAIDAASDAGDEELLRKYGKECERRLASAQGMDRVLLNYYRSNTYGAIIEAKGGDDNYIWSWEQPDGVQNALALRRAIIEPAFETCHSIRICQIRTNLANRLSSLGRPVAANEQWLKVLEIEPHFAKALAARGQGICFLAQNLYERGHTLLMLAAARSLYEAALDEESVWESGDRDAHAPRLNEELRQLTSYLKDIGYNESFDLNRWSLGATEEERSYRSWCLRERLFLNPLNETHTCNVAATDVLHLPSHTYKIEEEPRFPAYYNLLKQEYISSRYRLYRALHEDEPEFLMRDVLMLDSGEGHALGHYTEDLRAAFRSAYSIFDKIGLFLNDYFGIGLDPRKVAFRTIWFENPNNPVNIRPVFKDNRNWILQGLFFLSKDLFDEVLKEVAEPDAANLARLRQQVEHRFLSFQHFPEGKCTETHWILSADAFQDKTLRLLKMAREALIYLSLAMHLEETRREEASKNEKRLRISLNSRRIDFFKRL